MNHKALMGIEYVTIIGIFILLLSTSFSYSADPDRPPELPPDPPGDPGDGDGDSGDGGNGGEVPELSPDTSPGDGVVDGTNTGTGGTVTTNPDYEITITLENGTESEPTVMVSENTYTIIDTNIEGTVRWLDAEEGQTLSFRPKIEGFFYETPSRLSVTTKKDQDIEFTVSSVSVPKTAEIITAAKKWDNRVVFSAFRLETDNVLEDLETNYRFTLMKSDLEGIDLNTVVLSKRSGKDYSLIEHKLTTLAVETMETYTWVASIDSLSLFTINAKEIIKAPTLCDNDGKCEPPSENKATCPSDCFTITQPEEQLCAPGETNCIGNNVYTCASNGKNIIKTEMCEFGCIDGKCLLEPTPQLQNTIYLMLAAIVIVIGLGISIIMLRK